MDISQSVTLGIIQGLTEFLPVSSSGHLVIVQSFIPGFRQPGVLFDVMLHFGTFLAVLIYFRKTLLSLSSKMFGLLLTGSIPAGIVGFFLRHQIETFFSNLQMVGVALLFTGAMNWMVDKGKFKTHSPTGDASMSNVKTEIKWLDALIVGAFQAVALIPGVSRSGSTIFAGVFRGIDKKTAATFSFLLSVPSVSGAVGLELMNYGNSGLDIVYIPGILAAFAIGYASIGLLMRFLVEKRFWVFGVYCFALGALTLIFSL